MTGRVTFGDLLDVAWQHIDQAGSIPGRPEGDWDLLDVTRSIQGLVAVMGRYLQDVTGGYDSVPLNEDVANAARHLRLPTGRRKSGADAGREPPDRSADSATSVPAVVRASAACPRSPAGQ